MRKIILTLLLFSTLSANFSWAADTHVESFFGLHSELNQQESSSHDEHEGSGDDDHCCHGLAHLLGFLSENSISSTPTHSDRIAYILYYQTRSQSPPTPPPNI